jgi:hypothetical protein
MKLATKLIIVIAVVYNGLMGYEVSLTEHPIFVLTFLSIDFFLIFYYMWLLIRENLGVMKFESTHKDLIKQAREEVSKMK